MKIKKVLLINPPDTRPPDMLTDKVRIGLVAPLGLAYIAAVLERYGIEVHIIDCVAQGYGQKSVYTGNIEAEIFPAKLTTLDVRYGLTDGQILSRLAIFSPDLVGVSCLFSNKAFDAHNVCDLVKFYQEAAGRQVITVMGGSHVSAMPDETIKDENVDYAWCGEGENLITMIETLNHGGKSQQIIHAGRMSMDYLPLPARHLLNMRQYLYTDSAHSGHKASPSTNINTSRGCPGRCNFCTIRCTFGESYRRRTPESVIDEIDKLVNDYDIKELDFEDDNLTADRSRAMAIFQWIIDRKYGLYLNSPSGLYVNSLDEEMLDKMKEAGFYSISLAIESGVPWVLKDLMNKKVDLVKAKRMVKYGRSIGLKIKAFFILGYPGETKETMQQTVDYAGNLGTDWCLFFPATNLPGTQMDAVCRQNGWLVDPNLDYRYNFFKPNIRTLEFDPDYVMDLKEKANRQINFERNTNLVEGRFDRAREDFQEVLKLYPDLEIAKKSLREAENGLS